MEAHTDPAPSPRYRRPSRRADLRERRRQDQQLADAMMSGRLAIAATTRFRLSDRLPVVDELSPRWAPCNRAAATAAATLATCGDPLLARNTLLWMLQETSQAGDPSRIVSLLLPPALALDSDLVGDIACTLRRSQRLPERLELRLTEAALTEPSAETLLCLSALRDLDIRLAVNDFGNRLGSLSLLRHLPLAAIRLDPALTHDLPNDQADRLLIRHLAGMAGGLGMALVALAVDSPEHCDILRDVGITEGIGRLAQPGSELLRAA